MCVQNVKMCVQLLRWFCGKPREICALPSQKVEFLRFELDSHKMTVELTANKWLTILRECLCLLQTSSPSIRQVCHVIGLPVASFPGVKYGPLYYSYLERDKSQALKMQQRDFDK